MVGAAGQPYSDTKIKFPFGRHVEIDGREYLMFLIALWIKACEGSKSAVVFNSRIDLLRNRIGNFDVGRKLKTAFRSRTVERALKSGIEREVPATKVLVDDRTNLPASRCPQRICAARNRSLVKDSCPQASATLAGRENVVECACPRNPNRCHRGRW